jgi:FkbM family methyltransferase
LDLMPVRAQSLPAPLGRLLTLEPVETVVSSLLRARLVRPAWRFFLRERLRSAPNRLRAYRLRGSGLQVVIEHRTPDVLVLDEVFYQGAYEPPPEVAVRLAAARSLRALDVGANIGMFGLWLLRRQPGATITAIEPDPRNAAVHRQTIERNGLGERWRLIEAAAAAADGTVAFTAGDFVTSRSGDGTDRVRAVDLFGLLRDTDTELLKLDAEGAEWEILLDARFPGAAPPLLAMEYHPWLCPAPDARATALAALAGAGYDVREMPSTAPPGHGSVWAWRDP